LKADVKENNAALDQVEQRISELPIKKIQDSFLKLEKELAASKSLTNDMIE